MTRAILALLLCSCGGLRVIGPCPDEAIAAYDLAVVELPSPSLDWLDLKCTPGPEVYGEIGCVVWHYGSTVSAAKFEVSADVGLAGVHTIHESNHAHLRDVNGDACQSHTPACGWDEQRLSALTTRLP
jgi:hypothetical protein